MIDFYEIFLNILKIYLIELKFIHLYCINLITSGHRITPGHLKIEIFRKICKKILFFSANFNILLFFNQSRTAGIAEEKRPRHARAVKRPNTAVNFVSTNTGTVCITSCARLD